jgi:NAD(P)-dependent dehydrogenase (short-subunit alcohol dehydrogenase family)
MSESAGVVTGAAGSIGFAISRALREAGATVLMTDRSVEVDAAAEELGAEAFVSDLVDDGGAEAVVTQLVERFGRIDFLVNVAGVQARGPVLQLDDSRWEFLYSVNLKAVFQACRAAAREMERNGGGAILNVSSNAATVAQPGIIAYGAMKAGVTQLTRGIAVELAGSGIRANVLAPGYVRTSMTADLFTDEKRRRHVISKIPLGRVAEPEEMAPAAVFLLSPAASFITGEVLHVDGGYAAQ